MAGYDESLARHLLARRRFPLAERADDPGLCALLAGAPQYLELVYCFAREKNLLLAALLRGFARRPAAAREQVVLLDCAGSLPREAARAARVLPAYTLADAVLQLAALGEGPARVLILDGSNAFEIGEGPRRAFREKLLGRRSLPPAARRPSLAARLFELLNALMVRRDLRVVELRVDHFFAEQALLRRDDQLSVAKECLAQLTRGAARVRLTSLYVLHAHHLEPVRALLEPPAFARAPADDSEVFFLRYAEGEARPLSLCAAAFEEAGTTMLGELFLAQVNVH